MSRHRAPFLPLLAVLVSLALTAPLALLPGPTAEAAVLEDCPTPLPLAELQARLDAGETITATGYTVSRGTSPEPFAVEILGLYPHWLVQGRQVIIVATDGPAIDRAGGIWAGMSGSPVVASDGRLIGGLAWGFSAGPSKLAGLTPAEDLLGLLKHPAVGTLGGTGGTAAAATLGGTVAREVRRRDPAAGLRMEPLRLPVPTRSPQAAARLQEVFDQRGLPLFAVPAGAAIVQATPPAGFAAPEPGGNFAAVLSEGAWPLHAVGTTTFRCGGYAVAFAHLFEAAGETALGASDARAIAVVDDPTLMPYKLTTVTAPFGTVDQDRWAGLRARLGKTPPAATVRSTLTDRDTGQTATATSRVLYAPLFPDLAAEHLISAADGLRDRWTPGTARLSWTVRGMRAGGRRWTYTRSNLFANTRDVVADSWVELWDLLQGLQAFPYESVTLGDVVISGAFERAVRLSQLGPVRASVDGGPWQPALHGVTARPGSTLRLEVGLVNHAPVILTLQIPADAGEFATVRVAGGAKLAEDETAFGEGPRPASFDALLARLDALPPNNTVVADLLVDELPAGGEPNDDGSGAAGQAHRRVVATVDAQVHEDMYVDVFIDREHLPSVPLERVAGSDRIGTAIAVAQRTYPEPGSVDTVVLARADDHADALAGAPLAARLDGPLLLTPHGSVPPPLAAELARLGAGHAVLLGGQAAISPVAAEQLRATGVTVERVAGADRFDTARLVAERVGGQAAFIALGAHPEPHRAWPDALAVSALAAAQQQPILLTAPQILPEATRRALDDLEITTLTVVGGTAAVPEDILEAARTPERTITRLAGRTRYETSLAIARHAAAHEAGASLWLVTGRNFPDALPAGPAAAADDGVLLLVDGQRLDNSPTVLEWIGEGGVGPHRAILVGGPAAISSDVEDDLCAALDGW